MAFNKIARKDSDFYVICTLPDFYWPPPPAPYVTHPSPSRSSPTWAAQKPSPKTYASTASPPLSLRLVKPTAPPAMNPPCPAARAYFPAPPPNLPGRWCILPWLKSASATSYTPATCSTWTTSPKKSRRPNPVFPVRPLPLLLAGQSDIRAEVFRERDRLCFWRHPAAGLEPQLLFRPRRYRLARQELECAGLPAHHPRYGGIGLYRRSGPFVPAAGSRWRWWGAGIVRERADLVQ